MFKPKRFLTKTLKDNKMYVSGLLLDADLVKTETIFMNYKKLLSSIQSRKVMGKIVGENTDLFFNHVSHVFTQLWFNPNDVTLYGEAELLETKNGIILKNYILSNKDNQVVFSFVGYGTSPVGLEKITDLTVTRWDIDFVNQPAEKSDSK